MIAQQLSTLPGFAEADILANEGGRLSSKQSEVLSRELGVGAFFMVLFGGATAWFIARNGMDLAMLVWIVASVVGAYRLVQYGADISRPVIQQADGNAWVECRSDDECSQYLLHIAQLELQTRRDVYKTLASGGPYRVYYLSRTMRLLSARALPGWTEMPTPEKPRRRTFGISFGGD